MNSKTLFAFKRSVRLRLAGLISIFMLWNLAHAAGETGPPGLEGFTEILLQITTYPFIGVALAFLLFKATNKAWVFVFMPMFYWALSSLAPILPAPTPEDIPPLFSWVGAWLYLPHVLATAIGYSIFSRKKKVWIFAVVPVLGLIVQFASLIFIFPN